MSDKTEFDKLWDALDEGQADPMAGIDHIRLFNNLTSLDAMAAAYEGICEVLENSPLFDPSINPEGNIQALIDHIRNLPPGLNRV